MKYITQIIFATQFLTNLFWAVEITSGTTDTLTTKENWCLIQGVSEGMVNILGGGSMGYSA
jgi:hypothetical protein